MIQSSGLPAPTVEASTKASASASASRMTNPAVAATTGTGTLRPSGEDASLAARASMPETGFAASIIVGSGLATGAAETQFNRVVTKVASMVMVEVKV